MREDRLQALFHEIDEHLVNDPQPSAFIAGRANDAEFGEPPFDELLALRQARQSPVYHKEGSAWNHTMLVVDQAAAERAKSRDPRALMWAALLHDIGKPLTTRERKGKITSYNHEKVGAAMCRRFLFRFTDDEAFIDRVASLVRWHMEILFVVKDLPHGDAAAMKAQADVGEVALLGYADRMGRFGADRETEQANIAQFLLKCGQPPMI